MDARAYDKSLVPLSWTARAYRITVRRLPNHTLGCDLWQESATQRPPHTLWERVDTWYADDPRTPIRSLEDVAGLLIESLMQQRLPGLD